MAAKNALTRSQAAIKNAERIIEKRKPLSDPGYTVFNLKKGAYLMIKPKFVFVDKDGNKTLVRFTKGANSIFADEQDETGGIKLEYIALEANNVIRDPQLVQFLLLHPGYGKKFSVVDPAGNAKREMERLEEIDNVWDDVRALELESLKSINLMLLPKLSLSQVNQMSKAELTLNLRTLSHNNPKLVREALDDPSLKTLYLYHLGVELNVIKFSPQREAIIWTDSNQEVCKVPINKDPGTHLSRMLLTDEYLKVRELLEQKIHD